MKLSVVSLSTLDMDWWSMWNTRTLLLDSWLGEDLSWTPFPRNCMTCCIRLLGFVPNNCCSVHALLHAVEQYEEDTLREFQLWFATHRITAVGLRLCQILVVIFWAGRSKASCKVSTCSDEFGIVRETFHLCVEGENVQLAFGRWGRSWTYRARCSKLSTSVESNII